jgi:uncharacterized phage protein gp47/JayE
MAGLTTTGITIKSVDEIVSDMEASQLANIDANLNVEADSVLGQLNGIYAAALADLWELMEQVYQAAYPDTASGQSLSYIAALTGALRQSATKATLDVRIIGTLDTVIPAGTQGYVDEDPDSLFETTAEAIIEEHGGVDWVDVTMQATETGPGPRAFAADGLLVIATPVSGMSIITIRSDYAPGNDEETDSELRIRREQFLAIAGASTVEAIRTEMLLVTGVDSCTVFENPTGTVDALGLPPKSIEVLVLSETGPAYNPQDIVDEILLRKPAGTETFGGLSELATDSSGNEYTVYYSEPTTVQVYVELTLDAETDGSYVGDENVEEAIADWATIALRVGDSVYASDIINVVADITGVISVDVASVEVDDETPTQGIPDLILTARQLGTITSDRVTVTS